MALTPLVIPVIISKLNPQKFKILKYFKKIKNKNKNKKCL
jgi:hypothetical protein